MEHFLASGYSGLVRYRYNAGGKTDILLSGLNVSGPLAIKNQHRLTYQIIYGSGLNRYRRGASTTLDHQGKIVSIDELAYAITFEHLRNSLFSTLIIYNEGHNFIELRQPAMNFHLSRYATNDFFRHFSENALTDLEYSYDATEDKNNRKGRENRLQLSMKYTFN